MFGCACAFYHFQVELLEGPLDQFTHEMEPFLRKQGMPVRLNKGQLFVSSVFCITYLRLNLRINFNYGVQVLWNLFQTLLSARRESLCHLSQLG